MHIAHTVSYHLSQVRLATQELVTASEKNLIIEPKLIKNRLKQLKTSGYHFNMNLDLARSPIHRQFVFKVIRGIDSRFSLSAKLADRKL